MSESFPVVRASMLEPVATEDQWLVEGLWPRHGVGILGGPPKSAKSWLGLDLALSIASGTPCLGRFDVAEAGPVLVYLAEDAPTALRTRLEGLCLSRGLDLAPQPIDVITAPSVRLDLERDRQRLRTTIEKHQPVLLLLDPFVRMHRVDENDAGHVAAILDELRQLQRQHALAICVVHHARKNGASASTGLALRGSVDFYAWADVLLVMQRRRDQLLLSIEHRSARSPSPLPLALAGPENAVHLEPATEAELEVQDSTSPSTAEDLEAAILAMLADAPEPLRRDEMRARLRVRNATLGDILTRLVERDRIIRHDAGWALP